MKVEKESYNTVMRVGVALLIAFLVTQFRFDYIEALLYDARVRLTPTPKTSGLIELIAVEPSTVEKLGRVPNAVDHLHLLQKLKASGAHAVVSLISPSEITGSFDELTALAEEMKSFTTFIVGIDDVALRGEEDVFKLLPPFDGVRVMGAPRTSDRGVSSDDVTRRLMISYQDQKMLHPVLAAKFNPSINDEKNIRGRFEYLGSNQTYIDYHPQGTYPTSGFEKVLAADFDPVRFKDRVIFIGRDIQTTAKDYVRTPYSREIVAMTALELNANMLDTLIMNSGPVRVPSWIDLITTALISILTVYVVLALKPTQGLAILASTIIGFFIFGWLAFWLGDVWIGMSQPFLAVFVGYYFFIPYRLIIENRRSWEYLQKNRLLTQVEELKTNFLSMMSHDLKTPIARIQGMTDIVMKDSNPLSPRQADAMKTLHTSSQELLEFVSSILNLGRIESKELELHMRSRDPNQLLNEVIGKIEHLAKSKNIEITTELEPLFSLKMDIDLIRQVFTNLIENALKYSPENSRVLVSSEEREGRVIVQVADQGQGIPEEELPNIFSKFYRSKNAKSSTIKGSGLGLYLAKYFVELHSGTISVDSRLGVGSTFTVELPLKVKDQSASAALAQ